MILHGICRKGVYENLHGEKGTVVNTEAQI